MRRCFLLGMFILGFALVAGFASAQCPGGACNVGFGWGFRPMFPAPITWTYGNYGCRNCAAKTACEASNCDSEACEPVVGIEDADDAETQQSACEAVSEVNACEPAKLACEPVGEACAPTEACKPAEEACKPACESGTCITCPFGNCCGWRCGGGQCCNGACPSTKACEAVKACDPVKGEAEETEEPVADPIPDPLPDGLLPEPPLAESTEPEFPEDSVAEKIADGVIGEKTVADTVPEICADGEEDEAVRCVNDYRIRAGLRPLVVELRQLPGCRAHCQAMSSRGGIFHAAGWMECVASGYATGRPIVNMWLNSSGHRAIIMTPNASHIVIGHWGPFWTLRVW